MVARPFTKYNQDIVSGWRLVGRSLTAMRWKTLRVTVIDTPRRRGRGRGRPVVVPSACRLMANEQEPEN